jgi:hypothetical protein
MRQLSTSFLKPQFRTAIKADNPVEPESRLSVEKGDIQYIAKRNKVVAAIIDMEFLMLLEDACRDWKRIEAEGEFPDPWEYAKVVKMVRQLDRGELELVDYEDLKQGLGFTYEDLQ